MNYQQATNSFWRKGISALLKTYLVLAVCLFCGLGSSLTQLIAWATMVPTQILETGSVSQAVSNTFDGEHACPLCEAAAQLQVQENDSTPAVPKKESTVQPFTPKLAFSLAAPLFSPSVSTNLIPWENASTHPRLLALETSTPPPRFH